MAVSNTDNIIYKSVRPYIEEEFEITDFYSSVITLMFVGSCATMAPILFYFWSTFTGLRVISGIVAVMVMFGIGSTLVSEKSFWTFVLLRSLMESVKSHYLAAAPMLVAELFDTDQRRKMLTLLYILNTIGTFAGTFIGTYVASVIGTDWRMALRIAPVLDVVALVLLAAVMRKPGRGGFMLKAEIYQKRTKVYSDIFDLILNRCLVFAVLGYAASMFITNSMYTYAPNVLRNARMMSNNHQPCLTVDCTFDDRLIYGLCKCLATAIGIILGVKINAHYKKRNPHGEPVVCIVALLVSVPLMCFGLFFVGISSVVSQILFFLNGICLAMNKVLINEIIMMVVYPNRRSWSFTEKSIIGLLGKEGGEKEHLWIFKFMKINYSESDLIQNHAMEFILYICPFMALVGAGCFCVTAKYFEYYKQNVEDFMNTPFTDVEQPLDTVESSDTK
ncbi:protein spinster homolog 1-like [Xenopus laevis]|uniref:Protein spinster homolog 1-like n=1 Tax=Xenopus laevis TaxID=8355 RepID=A0A8J1ML06_XENLA|nr:protein spinster homolog 1-like [Xenopus laevis]